MKSSIVFAAAAAALLSAHSAAAAPLQGVRVELVGGWDNPDFDYNPPSGKPDSDGAVYGLGLGYDFALGKQVALGADLEATDSSAGFTDVTAGATASYALGRDLYAGGRLTVAVAKSLNLLFKVGYSDVRVNRSLVTPVFAEDISYNASGLRLAGGAQVALGQKAYVGAEYRWTDYDTNLERGQAVATLGFRF